MFPGEIGACQEKLGYVPFRPHDLSAMAVNSVKAVQHWSKDWAASTPAERIWKSLGFDAKVLHPMQGTSETERSACLLSVGIPSLYVLGAVLLVNFILAKLIFGGRVDVREAVGMLFWEITVSFLVHGGSLW